MKKERHLIGVALLLFIITFILSNILFLHDFLCINKPYSSGILVVEGWVPDECLSDVQSIYCSGNYKMLVVLGGHSNSDQLRSQTLPEAQTKRLHLIQRDIHADSIALTVDSEGECHYTYRSAVALRKWLLKFNAQSHLVDVYTVGVHSRKTYVTFERVLSPDYQVGILSGKPLYYSPKYWFLSGEGIYLVYKNFFGYLYANFFPFHLLE